MYVPMTHHQLAVVSGPSALLSTSSLMESSRALTMQPGCQLQFNGHVIHSPLYGLDEKGRFHWPTYNAAME